MYGKITCASCTHSDPDEQPTRTVSLFCLCSAKILCFLSVLLAGALGLILGAIFFFLVLPSLAAVIVGAAILAIAVIALVIYRSCCGCTDNDE